ncbi:MAG: uracil-DNA glycosylase family protein [Candidatus Magasanikbacteria bacterium]|jgi:uracil-DNA glycosylase|nr:uracil-DNA glycosylase family protein [Candidatus Magasanikbacteria bacterium]
MSGLDKLLAEIRACTICAEHLPLGPRPVLRVSGSVKLLIIGQAPGTKVHESGVPWDDASGERLRDWLGLTPDVFYDDTRVAIMPMGFCYPGSNHKGGDNPPRPECAPAWHSKVLEFIPQVELTLLVGMYAQKQYLGPTAGKTMTETVRAWRDYLPGVLPTPHPSWRTTGWMKKNPWFEEDVVPDLQNRIRKL